MKKYIIYTIYLVLMTAMLSSVGCASKCGQQRRYWNNHRAV